MAYVPPNSVIKLLADVPIDSSFDHTLWFESSNAQYNYFNSKAIRDFTNVTYVRKGRGYIKVEAPADQLYACNYMMYQNTSYGNKWFYAFCQVEYVNDATSAVYFTIDPLQTWFFEMQLGQCFVEREHSTTDNIGENLVPENLETGEYMITDQYVPDLGSMEICVLATFLYQPPTGTETRGTIIDTGGMVYDGVYSGVWYNHWNFNDAGVSNVNTLIIDATREGKADGILSIILCPSFFFPIADQTYDAFDPVESTFTAITRSLTFDGYVPKNNKLFTAPYMSMVVKTPTNMAEFGYEYFRNPNAPQFKMSGTFGGSPSILLEPLDYKSDKIYSGQAITENYFEGITLDGFPMCSFNIDTYKAWLAQNGASLIVNGALAAASLGMTIAKGIMTSGYSSSGMLYPTATELQGPPQFPGMSLNSGEVQGPPQYLGSQPTTSFNPSASGLIGSLGAIGNIVAQMYQHSILPNTAKGSPNANSQFTAGRLNFYFCTKYIRPEFAKIIDQYFDRFGYACHQIKVPNIHARRRWTYTKTVGCQVHGNLPADAVKAIQAIFDNGITFWADIANFGNYSLNNDVITTP